MKAQIQKVFGETVGNSLGTLQVKAEEVNYTRGYQGGRMSRGRGRGQR